MRRALIAVLVWAALCNGADEKRDKKIIVPVTESELTAIEKAAKEAHLDVPDFVRARVMEGVETEEESAAAKSTGTDPEKRVSADSGESPLEGWKVVYGPWTKEKDGVTSSGGSIQWDGEIGESIDLEFEVTLRKRTDGLVGIAWNAPDMKHGAPENPPRNLAMFTGSGNIQILSQPDRPGVSRQRIPYDFPLDKPVRVRAKISKQGIQMTVGKQKITALVPSENLGKLQLHISTQAAGAIFANVKVKSK